MCEGIAALSDGGSRITRPGIANYANFPRFSMLLETLKEYVSLLKRCFTILSEKKQLELSLQ